MENKMSLVERRTLKDLAADQRGAGLVEYIILVGLIALAAVMGFRTMGDSVNTKADNLAGKINDIGN